MAVRVGMGPAQQQPMGRRLLGTAGSIVGSLYGGPAGGAIGGALGNQLAGPGPKDLNNSQIDAGSGSPPPHSSGPATTAGQDMSNPMARRMDARSQDPQAAPQAGLDLLSQFPPDDPLRQAYTEPLLRAQMMAEKKGRV